MWPQNVSPAMGLMIFIEVHSVINVALAMTIKSGM
jgi:hypothetical protein